MDSIEALIYCLYSLGDDGVSPFVYDREGIVHWVEVDGGSPELFCEDEDSIPFFKFSGPYGKNKTPTHN